MEDVREVIRQFILTTYLPGESRDNLRDDTPLLTSGILDSLAALAVASFVGAAVLDRARRSRHHAPSASTGSRTLPQPSSGSSARRRPDRSEALRGDRDGTLPRISKPAPPDTRHRTAVVDPDGRQLTYADLELPGPTRSRPFSASRGVSRGDRVGHRAAKGRRRPLSRSSAFSRPAPPTCRSTRPLPPSADAAS